MFARKSCYFFVRPKKSFLEVVFFLGRPLKAPQVKRSERPSRTKLAHIVHVTHRDQVEAPITDWLREAYALSDASKAKPTPKPGRAKKKVVSSRSASSRPRPRR